MEQKMTFEQYLKIVSDILQKEMTIKTVNDDIKNSSDIVKKLNARNAFLSYKKYCESKQKCAFDERKINLSKEVFFAQNKHTKGSFADFWFVFYDLKSYMLKEIVPDRLIKKSDNINHVVENSRVIPEIVKSFGLDSAKYYITEYWDENEDNASTGLFLVTPSFLEQGDRLYNIEDLIHTESRDAVKIEEKLKAHYKNSDFPESQIENLIKDYIKAIVVNKIINNTDETNSNLAIIENKEKNSLKLAPLYDFDFVAIIVVLVN